MALSFQPPLPRLKSFLTHAGEYDLDFFMKSTDHGLEVSEVAVHKEAGKPRYGWVEKDGVWSKQMMQ